jgi:hypothetical protein
MKYLLFYSIMLFNLTFLKAQENNDLLKDFVKKDGFFTFYWNENKGKVYVEIKELNQEILYYSSLSRGVGSNDIGLDRGRLGSEHVVKFEKLGNKLLMIEPNYKFRALSNDPLEQQAVEESFAKSAHFGFEILKNNNGVYLIDFTPFLLRDALDASGVLANTRQGNFSFDASRSGIYAKNCKSFPENTEFETVITLSGSKPGNYLSSVVPTPQYVTMHQHHSFVKLPEPGFKPREYDPRIGYNGIEFYDYSSPINEPILKKYTSRHRLAKKDPNAVISEPVKPIIYYLDPGTPEPIRSALFEGATWWNQAFEAAGYKDAFQVKMLPPDSDPMDIRYNLIQWVHRSTRGWSYGASVIDPRTGEILKGKVTLGSLRVRQDYLLAQGLSGDFSLNDDSKLNKLALDRLKQLSAHEIGHTLGLPHNYISSIQGRASVMDYPHPLVYLKNGKVELEDAYTLEIGEYDKSSIIWGYQDFPNNVNEKQGLEQIVQNLFKKNLQFLTDQDARPDGSVHPQTHLWDNGADAVAELNRLIELRSVVLNNFDEKKLPKGIPMATLEEVFVPMYMFHRYQVQGAAKVLGGAYYTYALNGDKQSVFKPVETKLQKESISALLKTLQPEFLAVPKQLLDLIPPRPFRYPANVKETFKRRTGLAFDVLSPAESAAQLTLSLMLNNQRVNRLATQQIFDKNLPSLAEVLKATSKSLIEGPHLFKNSYYGQINRVVAEMYINELIKLKESESCGVEVKSNVSQELKNIQGFFVKNQALSGGFGVYITQYLKNIEQNKKETLPQEYFVAPDGQPIDQDYDWLGQACGN